MFLATIAVLTLLVLVIFSTPFIKMFYFLRTSAEGGYVMPPSRNLQEHVGRYDLRNRFGYQFQQLVQPLPMLLVLYPAAAGVCFVSAVVLLPLFFSRREPRWPYVVFGLLSALAFLATAGAFAITMYLFTVARDRFHATGLEAEYGPAIWMALAATAVMLLVAMNAGCATCPSSRFRAEAGFLWSNASGCSLLG
ncbi:uncharacterized protein BXZ73DRAFT_96106 [Epithele typhae]|uniref:uncharacterized protein n=1 Tax=Epithele typhae TaxID=378194 RepID=UPI0020083E42|nr:uncharacterized protein BXZ73DRAFT_96106 [Epithele typhae]KAH9945115.1 hypothetical protein BXZ73DRAFT_96106 [Epithele typhae]